MPSSKKSQKKISNELALMHLSQILGFHVKLSHCFDASLARRLRSHTFKSQQAKDYALKYFCSIVFSDRNVHDAIHISIEGLSCMNSIPIEQSIAKGHLYQVVEEFNCHSDIAVPMWYLTSSVSS